MPVELLPLNSDDSVTPELLDLSVEFSVSSVAFCIELFVSVVPDELSLFSDVAVLLPDNSDADVTSEGDIDSVEVLVLSVPASAVLPVSVNLFSSVVGFGIVIEELASDNISVE